MLHDAGTSWPRSQPAGAPIFNRPPGLCGLRHGNPTSSDSIGQNARHAATSGARRLLLRSGAPADMSRPCQATCEARTMMTACRGDGAALIVGACVDSTGRQHKGLVARSDSQNSAEWASTGRAAALHWLSRWGMLSGTTDLGPQPRKVARCRRPRETWIQRQPAPSRIGSTATRAWRRRPPKNRMSLMQCHDGRQLGRDGCTASRTGTWIFWGMCRVCLLTFYWFRAAQRSRVGFGRVVVQIRPPFRVMG
jgi:hypothetical protein